LLNSKELLELTGISRATLNNYIALGIVPRPEVLPPEPDDGAAPRIGYFPPETAQRIAEIQRLKQEGWSMSRIAAHFGAPPASQEPAPPRAVAPADQLAGPRHDLPHLSIGDIAHPAYLVTQELTVLWTNAACAAVLGSAKAGDNALAQLMQAAPGPWGDRLARFHVDLARQHGVSVERLGRDLPSDQRARIERLAQEPQPRGHAPISHVCGPGDAAAGAGVCVYAVQFREGILFVHVPRGPEAENLASLLQAREVVLGGLERKRLPVLADVAVVVTDLQHAPRLWSALPAEEYFELINQIWLLAEPIIRRHRGTPGKHPRDGIACYFLGQRDDSYVWNAIAAAHEMREAMQRVNEEWQARKGWATELCMNTGIDAGRQWLGSLRSGAAAEFTMFGETLNRAAQVAELASHGAIWATKDLLAKLAPQEKQRLRWGVHRRGADGHAVLVPAVFSTADRLAEPGAAPDLWRGLAGLPITEIVAIAGADGRRERTTDQQPI